MKMIKTLLFLTLFGLSQSGCPSACNCTSESVQCIEKGLEYVPNFNSLDKPPSIIDLSGNKINTIDKFDFSFDGSDSVIELYLNNSELLDIDFQAFDEMERLQNIYLGENLLNSVDEELFENLPDLVLVDLSNNLFSGDMPKIKSPSLEVLAMANSKITNIPADSLDDLPNLRVLLLHQNNIKSIDPAVFANVTKNSLFVRLSYNVWDCSCQNMVLFEYLADKNLIDVSEPYQCLTNESVYINIYEDNVLQSFKKACSYPVLNSLIDGDYAAYKEETALSEEYLDLEEVSKDKEGNFNQVTDGPSFSLLKENEDLEMNEKKDNIKETNDLGEKPIYFIECQASETTDNSLNFNNVKLIAFLLCSFVIGIAFGYCINHVITTRSYKQLKMSESAKKLLFT